MREKGGGVDSDNFFVWAQHFAQSVRDQTLGGRKVLLTYDGCRYHMSLKEGFMRVGARRARNVLHLQCSSPRLQGILHPEKYIFIAMLLDPKKIFGVLRSGDDIAHVLTINGIENLMEAKRMYVRDAVLGCSVQVTASELVDTTHGAVLTSTQALAASRDKARHDAQKRIQKQVDSGRKSLAAARRGC